MGSESKYMPGTLLWSKIGNYPFWPSMISYDPSTGQCFKEKKARGKPKLIYHVQFFGQSVEHGWTSPGRIFLFDGTGESGFNKKKEALLRQACGKAAKKNIQVMFNVPEVRRASWNLAIEEALEAHKISNIEERFATHVFMYETADKKAKSKTAPISCDFSERKGADQPQIERAKRKNSNDSLEELHPVKKIKHNDVKLTSEIKMRIKKKKMLSDGDFDDVCKICKKDMVDFSCSGNCLQSYHIGCVGLLSVPKVFKCSECDSGNFACFICKKSNGLIKKCKYSKCRKFYHDKCLNKYCYTRIRNSSSDKICGFHSCLTCYSENAENIMSFKG
ncbi:histone-lysine N-methyltransferase NSD2-like [Uloborus diversus]|uniref:histone-lysine N-methyltransferase NSD2-like n=1 Tax=Uloborus diversus TaxID=327109 RepID=UPI00240A5EC2|nr:histone-lysine N-methyltransferase NSD2-like [Uloborus diversus]